MEHAAGMTHLSEKGLTYADISDLAETQYPEPKGVGKCPPAAHAKDSKALPSSFTHAKSTPLSNAFRRDSPLPSCATRAMTLVTFVEKGHWANKCPNNACFTMKPHSDTVKPNGHSSGPSGCPGCRN